MAQRARSFVFVAVLGGLCVLASGCGGSPGGHVAQLGTTSTPSSSQSTASTRSRALAYARCMQTHGVPLWPDPASGGSSTGSPLTLHQLGVTSSQLGSAEQACRSLVPTAPVPQPSAHALAQALTFSRCMRSHGVSSFPDPASNGAIAIPHALESSPTYLAALRFCLRRYGAPPVPSLAAKA